MEDPGKKKRRWIVDLILIILAIILVYFLYTLVGGRLTPGDMVGGSDPIGQITEGLRSIGQGLRDMFGNMVP
jgi:hypothetical protein